MASLQIPLPATNVVDDGSSSDESTEDETNNEEAVQASDVYENIPSIRINADSG